MESPLSIPILSMLLTACSRPPSVPSDTAGHEVETGEVSLATAPEGHRAGNAGVVVDDDGITVVWEHSPADKSDTQLRLFHLGSDPFDDGFTEQLVDQTVGQAKPVMRSDGADRWLLANRCAGDCDDPAISSGVLRRFASGARAAVEEIPLPLDGDHDVGRGSLVVGDELVVCVSDTFDGLESLRCDDWIDGAFEERFVLTSEGHADHPSAVFDGKDLVVGFVGEVDGRREVQVRLGDGSVVRLEPGNGAEDVRLRVDEEGLHALWRARAEGGWALRWARCAEGCDATDRWTVETLSEAGWMEGLGWLDGPRGAVGVWSEGEDSDGPLDVHIVEGCREGAVVTLLKEHATTNQGDPAMAWWHDTLLVAFTHTPEGRPAELHVLGVEPTCL